jgi:copper chaperone CopZ
MRVKQALRTVQKLYSKRVRRTYLGRNRAHIELRALSPTEHEALADALERGFAELRGVRWAEVHRELSRVVVSFDDDAFLIEELVSVVETAERSVGVFDAHFRDEVWEHPGDDDTVERLALGMVSDALGLASISRLSVCSSGERARVSTASTSVQPVTHGALPSSNQPPSVGRASS